MIQASEHGFPVAEKGPGGLIGGICPDYTVFYGYTHYDNAENNSYNDSYVFYCRVKVIQLVNG